MRKKISKREARRDMNASGAFSFSSLSCPLQCFFLLSNQTESKEREGWKRERKGKRKSRNLEILTNSSCRIYPEMDVFPSDSVHYFHSLLTLFLHSLSLTISLFLQTSILTSQWMDEYTKRDKTKHRDFDTFFGHESSFFFRFLAQPLGNTASELEVNR